MPSPCHASLCLRQALLIKATPSLPVSVHRRCMPRLCFAITEQCVTLPSPLVAQRVCAVAIRSLSQLGCSTPLRIGQLPVLRGAVRFLAHPSPIAPMLCRAVPSPWRRIALLLLRHASPRNYAARPRVSTLSPRATVHPLAVPSHTIATLRQAVATPARSRRSTRSGPCRCCATGRCRRTARSRAIPARAASPTCS